MDTVFQKDINHKGIYISQSFFGWFEIYHKDRFLKFDTLQGCKDYINANFKRI